VITYARIQEPLLITYARIHEPSIQIYISPVYVHEYTDHVSKWFLNVSLHDLKLKITSALRPK